MVEKGISRVVPVDSGTSVRSGDRIVYLPGNLLRHLTIRDRWRNFVIQTCQYYVHCIIIHDYESWFLYVPWLAFSSSLISCNAQSKKKEKQGWYKRQPYAGGWKGNRCICRKVCFWCGENISESVLGVDSVISGYAGRNRCNPLWMVSTELTGHAESILVYYDPKVISYAELLKVFFSSQDPTTDRSAGSRQGKFLSLSNFLSNKGKSRH